MKQLVWWLAGRKIQIDGDGIPRVGENSGAKVFNSETLLVAVGNNPLEE
nr:hypothetical protein [Rubidibacter lacunae]